MPTLHRHAVPLLVCTTLAGGCSEIIGPYVKDAACMRTTEPTNVPAHFRDSWRQAGGAALTSESLPGWSATIALAIDTTATTAVTWRQDPLEGAELCGALEGVRVDWEGSLAVGSDLEAEFCYGTAEYHGDQRSQVDAWTLVCGDTEVPTSSPWWPDDIEGFQRLRTLIQGGPDGGLLVLDATYETEDAYGAATVAEATWGTVPLEDPVFSGRYTEAFAR